MPSQKPTQPLWNPLAVGGDASAYWLFSEGSGTTGADLTGGGNTATLDGSTAWITDDYGPALSLPQVADRVLANGSALTPNAFAVTIHGRVRSYATSANTLCEFGSTVTISLSSASAIALTLLSNTYGFQSPPACAFTVGQNFVATFRIARIDATTVNAYTYLNGSLASSGVVSFDAFRGPTTYMGIGGRAAAADSGADCVIHSTVLHTFDPGESSILALQTDLLSGAFSAARAANLLNAFALGAGVAGQVPAHYSF